MNEWMKWNECCEVQQTEQSYQGGILYVSNIFSK